MKRLISLILVICMCISIGVIFTSCNKKNTQDNNTNTNTESPTEAKTENKSEENTTDTVNNIPEETTDKSGYSVFYCDTSDDAIYLIEYNKLGLPVAVYYDESFYGECDGERRLEFSIEYDDNNLISKISTNYDYYEFKYQDTYALGMGYQANTLKKVETGEYIIVTYTEDNKLSSISAYDVKGSLMQFNFNENGRVSTLLDNDDVNVFAYDNQGRFISCTRTNLKDDSKNGVLTFSYNGDDSLPCAYTKINNGEIFLECKNIAYTDKGELLSATLTYYYDGVADYICENIKNYDENGLLLNYELKEGYADEADNLESYITELKYNELELIIEKLEFEYYNGEKTLVSKTTYEYDENKNCILEIRYSYENDGETVKNTNSTAYTYNENNLCISRVRSNGDEFYREYDSDGLLIYETNKHNNGESVNTITYKWVFDEKGRLIETATKKYTYDENGRIVTYFDIYSSHGDGRIYEFTYDDIGRIIKTKIINKNAEWNSELQDFIILTSDFSSTEYTYSEDGKLIAASIWEKDYKTGDFVTNNFDYTTIK